VAGGLKSWPRAALLQRGPDDKIPQDFADYSESCSRRNQGLSLFGSTRRKLSMFNDGNMNFQVWMASLLDSWRRDP